LGCAAQAYYIFGKKYEAVRQAPICFYSIWERCHVAVALQKWKRKLGYVAHDPVGIQCRIPHLTKYCGLHKIYHQIF
jgi:hypothetical protein